MWQEIIVGLCVLAAVIFLLRRWLPFLKSHTNTSGCGGCNSCDTPRRGTTSFNDNDYD